MEAPAAERPAGVRLGTRYVLFPDQPLPSLNADGALAFRASEGDGGADGVYGLICEPSVPVRVDVARKLRETEPIGLVELLEVGVLDWPVAHGRRLALVYRRPGGPALSRNLNVPCEPMGEDALVRQIVAPVAAAVRNLGSRGIGHGAIRPDNLFLSEPTGGPVLLGDCVTAPAGFGQPPLFEPIERAQADPAARGPATAADDLFALGATVLWMAAGGHPLAASDEATVMALRLDRGSYGTYLAEARLPTGLHELLRALLADDVRQRPTAKEVEAWAASRRLPTRPATPPKRAARAFEFGGGAHLSPRQLAHAFAADPVAAAPVVASGEVERWIRRSVLEEDWADVVRTAQSPAGTTGAVGAIQDRIVARTVAALDPIGPLRYKGRACLPAGIGSALHAAVARGEDARPLTEAISGRLVAFALGLQVEGRADASPLSPVFEQMRALLEQTTLGGGIERVLYELSPQAPCLSPMLGGDYVGSASSLLAALDARATRASRPLEPMDRHVAGFLLARNKKLDERLFAAIGPGGSPAKRAIGLLTVLAEVQKKSGPASLPGLGRWMTPLLRPAIDRFRAAEVRKRVGTELAAAAATGDLSRMLAVIDDPALLRNDGRDFDQARQRYKALAKDIEEVRRTVEDPAHIARTVGRQVTAVVSALAAGILVFVIVVRSLGGGT